MVHMSKKILFIVNPASRGGKSKILWEEIKVELLASGLNFDYKYTQKPKDAIELAKVACESKEYEIIVSFGGDGTVNEVLNGILKANVSKIPSFTIFPSGTGSDTVRTLGIPKTTPEIIRLLKTNNSHLLDVGEVLYINKELETSYEKRYFLNACDIGIGATVVNTVNQMNQEKTQKNGKAKYFRSIIQQVLKFKPFNGYLTIDGKNYSITRTVIIAICNGRFFGGGVKVSPLSKMDDNQLELVATQNARKVHLFDIVSKIYRGSHVGHPKVVFHNGKKFAVQLEKPHLLETDGEVVGLVTDVEILVAHHKIKVLY